MSTAFIGGGYTATVDGEGTLACFNSAGTRLFTFPPRRACTAMFQHYVEKIWSNALKAQAHLMGTMDIGSGHRGFSQRLHRDAYFEGTNPDDEFNTIRFVFSDIDRN